MLAANETFREKMRKFSLTFRKKKFLEMGKFCENILSFLMNFRKNAAFFLFRIFSRNFRIIFSRANEMTLKMLLFYYKSTTCPLCSPL